MPQQQIINKIFDRQECITKLQAEINLHRERLIMLYAPFGIGEKTTVGAEAGIEIPQYFYKRDYSYRGKPCKITSINLSFNSGDKGYWEWRICAAVLKKDGTPGKNEATWRLPFPATRRSLTPEEQNEWLKKTQTAETYEFIATVKENSEWADRLISKK